MLMGKRYSEKYRIYFEKGWLICKRIRSDILLSFSIYEVNEK